MVDYKNTKIYYIQVGDKRYYGHTAEKYLSTRESKHRSNFKQGETMPLYKLLRENNMNENDIKLVFVENFPCENVEEAKQRERWWVEYDGELNKLRPIITDAERLEYFKTYYKNNKEEKNTYSKQYRQDRLDERREKDRDYYYKNKETVLEKLRRIVACDVCGKELTKNHLSRHKKTSRCQALQTTS
jgi:hypothetical protein